MSKRGFWHIERKRSWWDGSSTTWCGAKFTSGTYDSDFWFIPATGRNCPACEAAKKRGEW